MDDAVTVIDKIHQFHKFGMILGLERMEELLERLGNPHDKLPVIHVAGTNGKGSVSKFLECGLAACGYRVGIYTSPFIERFEERIRFDGADISPAELELYGRQVIEQAEAMAREGHDSPTEFEVVTAIAFLYFMQKQADIVILEVGLGGLGDSTNVIRSPLACAITSVSYDHTDRLGSTLTEIASNKAGIIKRGCPVISNVPEHEAAKVIAKSAYNKGSRLYDVSGIRAEIYDETPFSQKVSMELWEKDYSNVEISMVGRHQAENLKTALAVLEVLRRSRKISLDREKLYEGLRSAKQPGRFEILHAGGEGKPAVIIDGAHNAAGAAALHETVKRHFPGKKILLIAGILADKQVDEILKYFVKISEDIIATEPDNPRRLAAKELCEHLRRFGIEARPAESAAVGLELAREIWDEYDVVLFAGSLYLIGEIRRLMRDERS